MGFYKKISLFSWKYSTLQSVISINYIPVYYGKVTYQRTGFRYMKEIFIKKTTLILDEKL